MTHHQMLAFSKSQVIIKKPTGAKKAESFSKSRHWHQKSQNESTLKLYILRSCCPEEE
jgi:hypothetical protein